VVTVGPVVVPGGHSAKAVSPPAAEEPAAAGTSAAETDGGSEPAPAGASTAGGADSPAGGADGPAEKDGAAKPAAKRTATRRQRKPATAAGEDGVAAAEPVNGTVLEGASEITEAPAATG
jgi:hypothetical protein